MHNVGVMLALSLKSSLSYDIVKITRKVLSILTGKIDGC